MKLCTKIIILVIVIAAGIGLSSTWLASSIMRDAFDKELKEKACLIIRIISEHLSHNVINDEKIPAKNTLQKIIDNNIDIDYAYIIGVNSEIFVHTFEGSFPKDLANKIHQTVHSDKPRISYYSTSKCPILDISYPLISGTDAHIHIGINESQTHSQVTTLYRNILIATLSVTLFGILIGIFFSKRITRPLRQLSNSMHSFGRRKDEKTISFIDGGQEVSDLTTAFNYMVSERIKAEKSLQKSEEKYRLIIENQNDMIINFDNHGRLLFVNPSYCKTFGKSQEELLGKKFMPLIHEDDREAVAKAINNVYKPPYSTQVEELAMTKDGLRWQEWYNTAILDKDNNIEMIVAIGRDIDKRKQTEIKLVKSEKQYQTLFDSINDLIYTQDMDGRFISVNRAMQKAFGYEYEELIGHKTSEFMGRELASVFESKYLKQIKAKGKEEGITSYFKKNGEKVYIEYSSSFVSPDDREPFISGTGRDVTERFLSERKVKKLQDQLAQAQKMESIGTLAGGIAHDFNNILFPMFGYLEMMIDDVPEDNPLHGYLVEVFKGSKRARDLVQQILTFSRQSKHELKPLKAHFIIQEALNLIKSSLPSTIEISQHIKKDCGLVLADPTQIHQVVMNLCTNAYHAMEKTGGKLTVTLKEIELATEDLKDAAMISGNYVCLAVTDTGTGIKQSNINRIFDPYFTTKKKYKGTGLGLAVTHGIVKSHGGHISVYSEPGKGTEFKVCLPVIQKQMETADIKTYSPIQKGDERILLVDDQDLIVDIEKQMLERLGYQVTARISSADALEAFRVNPDNFDLVITDMTMPNMTGDKLSKELIKIRSDIPIILCTGFSEIISKKKSSALGIKGFLMKPFAIKDLSYTVRKVLDQDKIANPANQEQ